MVSKKPSQNQNAMAATHAPMMGGGGGGSGQPPPDVSKMSEEDFKQYVLYVFPGDENCDRAMTMLTDEVHVADVTKMPRLPAFIDGVPILGDKKSKELFRGTSCMEKLSTLKKSEVAPAPTGTGFSAGTGAMHARTFDGAGAIAMPFSSAGSTSADAQISDSKVSEDSVAEYMQRRTQFTDRVVDAKKAQQGHAPAGAPPTDDPRADP